MVVFQHSSEELAGSNPPLHTMKQSYAYKKIARFQLPANFTPSKFSVLCGRGKACTSSPGNRYLKSVVNFVTESEGARGAVAEACLHILEKFFEPYNPLKPVKREKLLANVDVLAN